VPRQHLSLKRVQGLHMPSEEGVGGVSPVSLVSVGSVIVFSLSQPVYETSFNVLDEFLISLMPFLLDSDCREMGNGPSPDLNQRCCSS